MASPAQSFGDFIAGQPPSFGDFVNSQSATPQPDKPSIASDALKYSPIGMVKGLADMIRTAASGNNPLAGMAEANAKVLDKAKQSFDHGHYAEAAGHFLNYIAPGGAAMEDISGDIQDGNYGHAAAKFGGLASSIVAGAKGPQILAAAGDAADAAGTIKRVATDPGVVREAVKVLPKGAQALRFYDAAKAAANKNPVTSLSDRVSAATAAAAAEADDGLLDAIAQGQGYPKGFKSVPAQDQQIVRNLAQGMRAAEAAKTSSAAAPSPPAGTATAEVPPSSDASAPAASSPATDLSAHLPDYGPMMTHPENQPVMWHPGPSGTPEPWIPFSGIPDARATLPPALVAKVDAIQAAKGGPTIAEQLRDEMLANGSITQEHLAPRPAAPQPASAAPAAPRTIEDMLKAEFPGMGKVPTAAAGGGVAAESADPFLDAIAKGQGARSFKSLGPEQQQAVIRIADQIKKTEVPAGAAPVAQPMAATPAKPTQADLAEIMHDPAVSTDPKIAEWIRQREASATPRIGMAGGYYATGAVDDSELAGDIYEAAHRGDRAEKLAQALHGDGGPNGITSEEVPNLTAEQWHHLSGKIGLNPPSSKTIAETARQLQLLERKNVK